MSFLPPLVKKENFNALRKSLNEGKLTLFEGTLVDCLKADEKTKYTVASLLDHMDWMPPSVTSHSLLINATLWLALVDQYECGIYILGFTRELRCSPQYNLAASQGACRTMTCHAPLSSFFKDFFQGPVCNAREPAPQMINEELSWLQKRMDPKGLTCFWRSYSENVHSAPLKWLNPTQVRPDPCLRHIQTFLCAVKADAVIVEAQFQLLVGSGSGLLGQA